MPLIGIIRGFGEGEKSTEFVIRLIKALKRRFRTKIDYIELEVGDCLKYGGSLNAESIAKMRQCDAIFAGDMRSKSNPIEYSIEDIALALGNNIEYTCISDIKPVQSLDVQIASYFDGGFLLREGAKTKDGCTETRVCSSYSAMNIVKSVSRKCENRRRRLAFVKDGDNEYCADLFYSYFKDFTMPLSNFRLLKFSIREICGEILYEPNQFDTIFASNTFAQYALGAFEYILKDEFVSYTKFSDQKSIYSLKSVLDNCYSNKSVPTINSYIIALADLLKDEFCLNKEVVALRGALERTIKNNISNYDGEEFISSVIEELNKPLKGIYSVKPKSRYIK